MREIWYVIGSLLNDHGADEEIALSLNCLIETLKLINDLVI